MDFLLRTSSISEGIIESNIIVAIPDEMIMRLP